MAGYPGSVGLTGYIAPADTLDTYALQSEVFNRGGYRSVANTTERDSITVDRRKLGMLVYCFSDDNYYTLKTGLNNTDWIVANFGALTTATLIDDSATEESWIQLSDTLFVAKSWSPASYLDVYLDANGRIAGRHLVVRNIHGVGDTGFLGRIQLQTLGGSYFKDNDGLIGSTFDLHAGQSVILNCDGDWWYYEILNNGSGSVKVVETISTPVTRIAEGFYFFDADVTFNIDNTGTNRVFKLKSQDVTVTVTVEGGVIDGVGQNIVLSPNSSIELFTKADDTYWILNEY